jgi:hypothetical protein
MFRGPRVGTWRVVKLLIKLDLILANQSAMSSFLAASKAHALSCKCMHLVPETRCKLRLPNENY